jgi:hypothetical protein
MMYKIRAGRAIFARALHHPRSAKTVSIGRGVDNKCLQVALAKSAYDDDAFAANTHP